MRRLLHSSFPAGRAESRCRCGSGDTRAGAVVAGDSQTQRKLGHAKGRGPECEVMNRLSAAPGTDTPPSSSPRLQPGFGTRRRRTRSTPARSTRDCGPSRTSSFALPIARRVLGAHTPSATASRTRPHFFGASASLNACQIPGLGSALTQTRLIRLVRDACCRAGGRPRGGPSSQG